MNGRWEGVPFQIDGVVPRIFSLFVMWIAIPHTGVGWSERTTGIPDATVVARILTSPLHKT